MCQTSDMICWAVMLTPRRGNAGSSTVSRWVPSIRSSIGVSAARNHPTTAATSVSWASITTGRIGSRDFLISSWYALTEHWSRLSGTSLSGMSVCRRWRRSASHRGESWSRQFSGLLQSGAAAHTPTAC